MGLARFITLAGQSGASPWFFPVLFWEDAALALGWGATVAALGRRPFARRTLALTYAILVVYAAINVVAIRFVSTPLTWPMLRAASTAIGDSIAWAFTPAHFTAIGAVIVTGAVLPFLLGRMGRLVCNGGAIAVGVVAATGCLAVARSEARGPVHSPIVTLVASALPRVSPRPDPRDWTAPLFEAPDGTPAEAWRGIAAGRNVVVIGLESTAAQYLPLYGAPDDLTPHIDELARTGLVFEHAYTATPDSIRSLFSVVCSRYPAFDLEPEFYATASCRSLADDLAAVGYASALFHSGRFDYLDMNAVIRNRGFDSLADAGDIGGRRFSSFGVGEPATVERMLTWLDALPKGRPFLLMYLPIAAHHPYVAPVRGPFATDDDFGRYRNAIRYGDAAIGMFVDGLRARGLADDTMWVIYGDHGQAFGQHEGNFGHTFFLYEENVRVPFIVSVPGATDAVERRDTTMSLVDVTPTILDLLGLQAREEHQGRSALDGDRRMALFFTDYGRGLVGLREGSWKFIHDLSGQQSWLFDLRTDPAERLDLATTNAARVATYTEHLRAWSSAQKHLLMRAER